MFQTPALVVMSIAATRMYRSLTDFTDSRYYPFCLLHDVLMLTAADVAVLRLSMPTRLGRGARRMQIPNVLSQCQFRPAGWRWPCTGLPRTIRLRTWANMHRMVRTAQIACHRTATRVDYRKRPRERCQETMGARPGKKYDLVLL